MIDHEPLIDKIRKLLAKAEGTDNPNEAEAFSAKAAALIAAHRIDPEHVRESLTRGSLGLRRITLGRGAYVRARLALLSAVADHHDCEVVFETHTLGTVAVVAGFEADLDVTELLYSSLHVQASAQMAATRMRTAAATQRWRRSFLLGYAKRIGELLEAARRRPAPSGGVPTLFDEVLPDVLAREQRVKEFAARAFGRVVAARAAAPAQASAWRDGHAAAGRADLGRNRLVGRRAIGLGRR
jgi:hypothetical protein